MQMLKTATLALLALALLAIAAIAQQQTLVVPGGLGNVVGPASGTDNAIVRFDGTTGKLIQDSAVSIADTTGNIVTPGSVSAATVVGAQVATHTDQETSTSVATIVSPGRQQLHPSAAKFWIYCTNSGTNQTIAASYNSSTTGTNGTTNGCGRTGVGAYTLAFTTAFSSVNYSCVTSGGTGVLVTIANATHSATQLGVDARNLSNTNVDSTFSVVCYGDQ
jgi:hypothetical protein